MEDGECEDPPVIEDLLVRARSGDEDAFRELTEPHRRELHVHCYRILGSVQDAEDLVQETLLAAWRGLDGFGERSSVRAWLYRIATNRSLNALRDTSRRPQRTALPAGLPEPTRRAEPVWLQPYPDVLLDDLPDQAPGPESRYEARESIELAFIIALQHLPPRQRAVLVLRDVLGYRTSEVAAMLDTSEVSVKGLLQRARATLQPQAPAGRSHAPAPNSARERELAGRFAAAMERGDTAAIVALLTADAWLSMPPEPHQYQGHAAISAFLDDRTIRRGAPLRVVPTHANTQPAFGCYIPTPPARIARAYGMLVLTLDGDAISALTWFSDTSVFPHFGLPRTLPT
jgi:RNA polymerase sigma-70 factor (TIGR02960 family)